MNAYESRDIRLGETKPHHLPPPLLTSRCALFLDFDGTLVELAAAPDQVIVKAGLPDLLTELHGLLAGALAIITGRRLESVDRWLPQNFAGAGLHGAQLRMSARVEFEKTLASPDLATVAKKLRHRFADEPGLLIEDKGGAVALHYRLAPQRKAECDAVLRELAQELDLDLIIGHAVIEARPRGIDKGVGLRCLFEEKPFAGRTPVFVGDDTTDEDAIVAAQQLGGVGIRVGNAITRAAHRLADVGAVHGWLERSRDALREAAS